MNQLSPFTSIFAAVLLAAPAAAFQVDDLVAHWSFDENAGPTFVDLAGNGHDASIGGGVALGSPGVAASSGLAARFDGNQMGMAKVADQFPLSGLLDNFSVAAWVQAESGAPSTIRRIFGGGGSGWSCGVTGNGLRFTTKGIQDFDLPYSYPVGSWFHVAFVFDASHDVTYFIDGVQVGMRTGASPANSPNAAWLIGAFNQTIEFWHGYMDDLQVYRGTLTGSDVAFLFQNPGFTVAPGAGISYCYGDSTATSCPCGNLGAAGEGCGNSSGVGGKMSAMGSGSVSADDLQLMGSQLVPGGISVLFAGVQSLNGGNGMLFGDGLRCAGGQVQRLGVRLIDAGGNANWGPGLGNLGQWQPGDTRNFQIWYQDSGGSPCGGGFNTSQAISQTFGQ